MDKWSFVTLISMLVLCGCRFVDDGTIENPSTLSEVALSETWTITPKPSIDIAQPSATLTFSSVQTDASSPIETRVPRTIMPTLPSRTDPSWLELLSSNGDCNLPCWIGIHVGDTEFPELGIGNSSIDPYASTATSSNAYLRSGNCKTSQIGSQTVYLCNLSYTIFESSGTILGIDVLAHHLHTDPPNSSIYDGSFTYAMQRYSLFRVFSELGPPNRIYFSLGLSHSPHFYSLYIFYDELDFMLAYTGFGVSAFNDLGTVRVCPTYVDVTDIRLAIQSSETGFSIFDTRYGFLEEYLADGSVKPFSDETDLSIDDFYNGIVENQGVYCFQTSY